MGAWLYYIIIIALNLGMFIATWLIGSFTTKPNGTLRSAAIFWRKPTLYAIVLALITRFSLSFINLPLYELINTLETRIQPTEPFHYGFLAALLLFTITNIWMCALYVMASKDTKEPQVLSFLPSFSSFVVVLFLVLDIWLIYSISDGTNPTTLKTSKGIETLQHNFVNGLTDIAGIFLATSLGLLAWLFGHVEEDEVEESQSIDKQEVIYLRDVVSCWRNKSIIKRQSGPIDKLPAIDVETSNSIKNCSKGSV